MVAIYWNSFARKKNICSIFEYWEKQYILKPVLEKSVQKMHYLMKL